jgi:methylglyoxal synthase
MGHVESRFGPFGDSVGVGARLVHGNVNLLAFLPDLWMRGVG